MARVVGEATGAPGRKEPKLAEAIKDALEKAPPPNAGDIQRFELLRVQLMHGGITGATLTRVIVEVESGPLPTLT